MRDGTRITKRSGLGAATPKPPSSSSRTPGGSHPPARPARMRKPSRSPRPEGLPHRNGAGGTDLRSACGGSSILSSEHSVISKTIPSSSSRTPGGSHPPARPARMRKPSRSPRPEGLPHRNGAGGIRTPKSFWDARFRGVCISRSATAPGGVGRPPKTAMPGSPRRAVTSGRSHSRVLSRRGGISNRGARIRTGDLCDPNAALYRTEPRPGLPTSSSQSSGRSGIRTHVGFRPHDFQSCALSHSAIRPGIAASRRDHPEHPSQDGGSGIRTHAGLLGPTP